MPRPPFRLHDNPADAHLQHDGYPLDMRLMKTIFGVPYNFEKFVFIGDTKSPQADTNYSSVSIAVNGKKRHLLPGYVLDHNNTNAVPNLLG